MPIDLYYMSFSQPARAALTVVKILGVKVNLKSVDFAKCEHLSPEFVKLNPNHTIPTLVDDGFVVFESGAIMTYLVNKYAPNHSIYPEEPNRRAKVDEALHFLSSSFAPALRNVYVPKIYQKQEPTQKAYEVLKEKIEVVEKLIGDKSFLTSNDKVTIADFLLASNIPGLKIASSDYPPVTLSKYYERVLEASTHFKEVMHSAII